MTVHPYAGGLVENVIIISTLAALAMASEWWLRRRHTRNRPVR